MPFRASSTLFEDFSHFPGSLPIAKPLRISGAPPSARAYLVVRFLKSAPKPLIILCPNDDTLQDFASDLDVLLEIDQKTPVRISVYPTWDQSPYSSITPTLKTRFARLQTLSQIAQKNPPEVILTTLEAAHQATLPLDIFLKFSLRIQVGESIGTRDALAHALSQSGYLRTESVDDPGTFAVRGEIIDLFPSDRSWPVRIELFGDTVEMIREYDPTTQRTLTQSRMPIQSLFVPPAREVLLNSETSSLLRERIKNHSDQVGISRAIRDPVLEALRYGSYPEHFDAWAPFAYPEVATLWSFLSGEFTVVFNDELSCSEEWERFRKNQKKLSQDAVERGLIVPPPQDLYLQTPELDHLIYKKSLLFLDQLDLVNSPDPTMLKELPSHSVRILDNVGLARGSKHGLGDLEEEIFKWIKEKKVILVSAATQSQMDRIQYLLKDRSIPCLPLRLESPKEGVVNLKQGSLSGGFRWEDEDLVVLTESEILGSNRGSTKAAIRKRRSLRGSQDSAASQWSGLHALSDLGVGDSVVHIEHGIGRYLGLVRLSLSGAPSDFLQLEYANKDKLYLPVYRLNLIQKYAGSSHTISLDRLGTLQFNKTKEKVKESVKKLAIDLVQLYAERKIRPGFVFSPRDSAFREFEASFPFEETPDQMQAIDSVLADMESGRVMDRLVCGDVGYGKTEVAIRAAFRAVSDGKQVAVLVPTTLLAQQHEQSFKNRLKDYPVIIESLSRFKTPKEQKKIVEALEKGKIDIIIGTHRLLSKDVRFQDLGLIVVDEEHRFGVEHKERLKTLKVNTHVLTLTATPIPRTLHMALSGLREISIINTPPVDRLPIKTYVSRYDESLIRKAIDFEISRGGQTFYLHNRVQSLQKTVLRLKELVPQAQVSFAHGQMSEGTLEDTMIDFYHKKANVLVCTSIIESGLDLPSANTIIIDRADMFGLSQLYQIRGRVGRGDQRAYSYLMIPQHGTMTDDAKKRLEVIQKFVELGSGFSIASHDLEIRGGGDLLGPQQSGNIEAVGFDLYTELLDEAIRELQGKPVSPEDSLRDPEIKVPFPAYLSEEYVADVHHRLSLYRRFSTAKTETELDGLEEELRDRFGDLPEEAQNLLWMIRIKLLLKKVGIETLTVGPEKVSLVPAPRNQLDPARTIALVSARPETYQLTPDSKLVVRISTPSLKDLLFSLEKLAKEFAKPTSD